MNSRPWVMPSVDTAPSLWTTTATISATNETVSTMAVQRSAGTVQDRSSPEESAGGARPRHVADGCGCGSEARRLGVGAPLRAQRVADLPQRRLGAGGVEHRRDHVVLGAGDVDHPLQGQLDGCLVARG